MNNPTNYKKKVVMHDYIYPEHISEVKINYYEKKYKRKIDKGSKFILIGNNIDGVVHFDFCEFANFEEIMEKLPKILYELNAYGEWDLKLFQVPENYKIKIKYGYYKYPNKGKLIYTHNYMDTPIKNVEFKKNSIVFLGYESTVDDDWTREELYLINDIFIEVLKIEVK